MSAMTMAATTASDTTTAGVGSAATMMATTTSDATMAASATSGGEVMTATSDGTMTSTAAMTTTGTTGGKKIRVGLVTDTGKVNDGTFNQFAYEGMKRAEKDLGVEVNYVETAQQSDYEKNMATFADQKYDLIIGVGFLMGDAIKASATKYPNTMFAIVDSAADTSTLNLKGLVFQEDQAGYLAGVAAALTSKTGKIGVVGGKQIPPVQKYVMGYEAGAKSIKADIVVKSVYIDSFTDAAKGAESAKSMISDGADVIFGAGGQTGSGGIQAAAAQGVNVIGVDQDEYLTTFKNGATAGSDKLITSALKRVDNAVYQVIKDATMGQFKGGNAVGTAANGGIDYAPAHKATAVMTSDITGKLDAVKKGLADGSIKTGVTLQ
ncbi:MAG: BMP family ABC transporter substrate-binding protein [Herpetosiphonaceae bacterium]|nr:BMP family ABC transporter substrate-binding protein [Herpetosiphonaceae bacterium]